MLPIQATAMPEFAVNAHNTGLSLFALNQPKAARIALCIFVKNFMLDKMINMGKKFNGIVQKRDPIGFLNILGACLSHIARRMRLSQVKSATLILDLSLCIRSSAG